MKRLSQSFWVVVGPYTGHTREYTCTNRTQTREYQTQLTRIPPVSVCPCVSHPLCVTC